MPDTFTCGDREPHGPHGYASCGNIYDCPGVAQPDQTPQLLKWTQSEPFGLDGEELRKRAPRKAYQDDAGFDLTTSERSGVAHGSFADVPCGIRIELPEGCFGLILGRSSTLRSRRLMVQPGVIDAGWRGPIFVAVWNLSDRLVMIEPGERLGQLLVLPLVAARAVWVAALSEHPRGLNGFGSTGA